MASANGCSNHIHTHTHCKKPLFSFGVISDIQYADIPNGYSFRGIPRYYRHSLQVLQRAVTRWNDNPRLHFALNFGDIVDGFCPKEKSLATVERVINELDRFNGHVYHMVGNHCLYNLPRDQLIPLLQIPSSGDDSAYYDFSPVPEFRFVVLDSYDVSANGRPQDHPNASAAIKFLHIKNPNADKNSPSGLVGLERRFVMFNGAFGKKQLAWLDGILADSTERRQKVIVCSHQPLDPNAASPEALPWNYEEAMEVVHRYKCVKACLAGHEHRGGYCIDSHGVHHRVLEAALECPPGSDAFGHIDVFHDKLVLYGADRMRSAEMIFSD